MPGAPAGATSALTVRASTSSMLYRTTRASQRPPWASNAGLAHIVSILSPRGGEHHQVLDSYEGVAAADSTIATQLGQITGEIAEHKDQAGYAGTAAKLRVAASVFGVL